MKKTFIYIIFLFVALLLIKPSITQAACVGSSPTWTADTCSQADVAACITSAIDGDTINIPAGSCTWTVANQITESLTFIGAGQGQTNITDGTDSVYLHTPFWFSGNGKTVRVSGFTFTDQAQNEPNGIIKIRANNVTFRFDHITFDNIKNRGFWIDGDFNYGVIDHVTHEAFNNYNYQGALVRWLDTDLAWSTPHSFGSSNAVFIEDNIYNITQDIDGVNDCTHGGRVVFRHNTINGPGVAGNHGDDSPTRGCLSLEVYNNTWNLDGTLHNSPWILQMRGGTAVWHDNSITTINGASITNPISFTNYRSCLDGYYPGKNNCDGTDPVDQNTSPIETYRGWACRDQVGRSYNQISEPVYEWNNTYNGTNINVNIYNAGSNTCYTTTHIQSGRDFYNDTQRPGYIAYTYPHPLTIDIDITSPSAPTGLTIE